MGFSLEIQVAIRCVSCIFLPGLSSALFSSSTCTCVRGWLGGWVVLWYVHHPLVAHKGPCPCSVLCAQLEWLSSEVKCVSFLARLPLLLSGQQHYHNFILHNLRGSLLAQSHTPPAAVARCVSHWSALIFTTSSFLYRTVCICLQDAKPPWIHNFPALSQGFYACGTRTLELNILLGTHLLGL